MASTSTLVRMTGLCAGGAAAQTTEPTDRNALMGWLGLDGVRICDAGVPPAARGHRRR